jgi:hypothetical protein
MRTLRAKGTRVAAAALLAASFQGSACDIDESAQWQVLIVSLAVPFQPESPAMSDGDILVQREAIANASSALLKTLPERSYKDFTPFTTSPYVTVNATPEALASLRQSPWLKGYHPIALKPWLASILRATHILSLQLDQS